jgi:HNH endonuclease
MTGYSLTHVKDHVLLRDLTALTARDRATTALLLAHIAEVDARRLYAAAGYSAMYHYCIRTLGFSEDMASKRIRAARVARRFPFVFDAIADGRLHVTGVSLLSSTLRNLRAKQATELLVAAENRTKDEILVVLAERFPQPDVAARVRALPGPSEESVLSLQVPGTVEVQQSSSQSSPGLSSAHDDAAVVAPPVTTPAIAPTPPARTTPLSPGRFALQLTMSAETREKLRRAEDLLGRAVAPGDLAAVLDRALDALLEKLERRLVLVDGSGPTRPTMSIRHVPAGVRRAVRARDGDQCTYVSDDGVRCEERRALELDHIVPVARGGDSSVANLRLRCRAHNQLEAEKLFGAGFMQEKRARAH